MLFNHQSGSLIVTPPKTGTTTLHRTLGIMGGGWSWVYGIAPWADDPSPSKHCRRIGFTAIEGYPIRKVYLVVRRPVPRFMSMVSHARERDGHIVDIDACLSGEYKHEFWKSCSWYESEPDAILRTHQLREDVQREFGIDIGLERMNPSKEHKELTEEQRAACNRMYRDDYDLIERFS